MLAGAGVANLAAWLGVRRAREQGSAVQLTAEIGLWGYEPMLGDPFVLNHGNFPTATMLGDAAMVLGGLVAARARRRSAASAARRSTAPATSTRR